MPMKLEVKRVETICMQWSRPRAGAEGVGVGGRGGIGVGEEVLKQKGRSLGVRYPPGSAILNCIPLGKFCNLSGPAPQSNLEIVIPKAVRPSEYHLLAGQPW